MDTDKILEKIMRWLTEPRAREMVKTIIYLVIPLFVLLMLRGVARRRATEKTSSAIQPKIRSGTTESLTSTESVKETMARQQKKIARELREVFGQEDSLLARAKRNQTTPAESKVSSPSESPESNERKMLQEELLKLFSRRPK